MGCLPREWCSVHTQSMACCRAQGLYPLQCLGISSNLICRIPSECVNLNNDDDNSDGVLDLNSIGSSTDDDMIISYSASPYNGSCCPCPSHNRIESATRIFCSAKLRTWGESGTNEITTVQAGEKVYVEGIDASTDVAAENIVWERSKNSGGTSTVTNHYTVFSANFLPDSDLDNQITSND